MRTLKFSLATAAALATAAVFASPAEAAFTFISQTTGNVCSGTALSTCTASGLNIGDSPLVAKINATTNNTSGTIETSSLFPSVTGSEFGVTYVPGTNTLNFTYNAGANDPIIHYVGVFQAGSYVLFGDPNPITSGSISLSQYFAGNPGWSHLDFYDTRVPGVPEPGTWAMMLVGFGVAGFSLRRRRKVAVQAA